MDALNSHFPHVLQYFQVKNSYVIKNYKILGRFESIDFLLHLFNMHTTFFLVNTEVITV